MTRVFTDGAEMGDLLLFSSTGGWVDNVTTSPRSGLRNYYFNSFGADATITLPSALGEFYFRAGVRVTGQANTLVLEWTNGANVLGTVRWRSDTSKFDMCTGDSSILALTGTTVCPIGNWFLVEIRVKIDASVGALGMRIDGVSQGTFSGNTQPGADSTVSQVHLRGDINSIYFDDLALNNTSGSVDNSWCGDGKIVMLRPDSAGDVTQLTPSSGSNWQCVDETPPNTTDYVSSATAGQYDLYNCGTTTLAVGEVVRRVQVEARVLEESAMGDSIKLGVKTEATEYFDAGQVVMTSYRRYVGDDLTVNPQTGIAWAQSELDALQVGIKVV